MTLIAPSTLSPSKVSSFTQCALAFKFSAIDRVPEPPSVHLTKGTVVHRALELLFWNFRRGQRTPAGAAAMLDRTRLEYAAHPDYVDLGLSGDEQTAFWEDAALLVSNLFLIEDPNAVQMLGTELRLEGALGSTQLRGIIDRLEIAEDGALVVTDYKTGRAPKVQYERRGLAGVHFYAFLCEEALGRRPDRIQLLHLREPEAIITVPTDQSARGLRVRAGAVWTAIEKACDRDDFRPQPGPLCDWCSFRAWCPAFGGDPAAAPRPADQYEVAVALT